MPISDVLVWVSERAIMLVNTSQKKKRYEKKTSISSSSERVSSW